MRLGETAFRGIRPVTETLRSNDQEKNARHIEDFCQLEEIPARMKYFYSMEDAANLIRRFSDTPSISLIRFFERAVYHFISGCGDGYRFRRFA